jgi:thioredoxin 1
VDSNQGLAMKFNVTSIPTLLVFKGGKVVEQALGARPKAALEEMLKRHLG